MTPRQLKNRIARIGISQVQAAKLVGIAPRTLRHWLAHRGQASEPVAILLQLLATKKVTERQIKKARIELRAFK